MRLTYVLTCVLCFGLTVLVQDYLRPVAQGPAWWMWLLNIAPSLLYAFACVLAVSSVRRWPPSYGWWAASGPLGYEILQIVIPAQRFDPYDVVASVLGALAALGLDRRIRPREAVPTREAAG